MTSQASLSALLHLQGLPPLPKSLTASYDPQIPPNQKVLMPTPSYGHPAGFNNSILTSSISSKVTPAPHGRSAPPVPPPRPNSRAKSSSSASSFRTSPDHVTSRTTLSGLAEGKRGSPLSLSSSPYPDSGVGRSSAESFSEPKAFVRVVKTQQGSTIDEKFNQLKTDMQTLRQQDMALLGHLLQLHQGIQDLRNILVPPPQPAPSSFMPLSMFSSSPAYPSSSGSRNPLRKQSHPQSSSSSSSSRLSMFHGTKFFSRRSSADKLLSEAMKIQEMGACGGAGFTRSYTHRTAREEDLSHLSDSLSSLEFGDM